MKHQEKVKLARRLSGKQTNHFISSEWNTRSERVAKKVLLTEKKQQLLASKRRENKTQVTI